MTIQLPPKLAERLKPIIRRLRPAMRLFTRCTKDEVTTRAAALAYYLVFSIFPLLILFSLIIGSLHIDTATMDILLARVLPKDMIDMLKGYLDYVTRTFDMKLLMFALVFSIYFPWRFIRSLMDGIRISYRQESEESFIRRTLKQILCTLLIPLTLAASLILIILYRCSIPTRVPFKTLLPGIVFSIIAWVISSIAFSFYVENFGDYSVIYGTLGAFVILLLWLYLTGLIFLAGSEINALWWLRASLRERRKELKTLARKQETQPDPQA